MGKKQNNNMTERVTNPLWKDKYADIKMKAPPLELRWVSMRENTHKHFSINRRTFWPVAVLMGVVPYMVWMIAGEEQDFNLKARRAGEGTKLYFEEEDKKVLAKIGIQQEEED